MRNKNLESLYYFLQFKYGDDFNQITFVKTCQEILKDERLSSAQQVADVLGYRLIRKHEMKQSEYRKSLTIRINNLGYALVLKSD